MTALHGRAMTSACAGVPAPALAKARARRIPELDALRVFILLFCPWLERETGAILHRVAKPRAGQP